MYMVIGAFFSETGTQLLRFLVSFDRNEAAIRDALKVGPDWDSRRFRTRGRELGGFKFDLHADSSGSEKSAISCCSSAVPAGVIGKSDSAGA
jgi:hypothetical protein